MNYLITGDIVNSETLLKVEREQLKDTLDVYFKNKPYKKDYFIRGDGLQLMPTTQPIKELIQLKMYLLGTLGIKIRLSLGLGEVEFLSDKLSDSDGEAFRYSGRGLDQLKEENKLVGFFSANKKLNSEWEIHMECLNWFENNLTKNQAEAYYWYSTGLTQEKIAQQLNIKQSSVNKRLKGVPVSILDQLIERGSIL